MLLQPFGEHLICRDDLCKDIDPESTILFKAYLSSLEIICIDIRSFDATEEVAQECFIFLQRRLKPSYHVFSFSDAASLAAKRFSRRRRLGLRSALVARCLFLRISSTSR